MSHTPIHIIGGGLAGSEAAWQIARPGFPSCCTRCGPSADRGAQDRRAGGTGLLQLVSAPTMPHQCGRPAARGDAPRRLADHVARATPTSCPPAARWPSTATSSRRSHAAARRAPAGRHRARRGRRSAPARLGQASSSPPGRSPRRRSSAAIQQLTGESELAFFDAIAPIVHLESIDAGHHLAPVALRQGRPRRHRRRLHQLPHDASPSTRRSSMRCWRPRRPPSRSGKPPRPTSTAACPSR